jgi:hypothetical protein
LLKDPFVGTQGIDDNFVIFTDFELHEHDDLNMFLDDDMTNIGCPALDFELDTKTEVIKSEHNYFELDNKQNLLDPGVCVHIGGGKLSLEFCASCSTQAASAWENEDQEV